MLWILFAGVFVYGLWTLIAGKLSVSRRKSVRGVPARLLGGALMSLPVVCIAMAFLSVIVLASMNASRDSMVLSETIASFSTLVVGVVAIFAVAFAMAKVHSSRSHEKCDIDMKHLSSIDAGGEPNFDALADHDRET